MKNFTVEDTNRARRRVWAAVVLGGYSLFFTLCNMGVNGYLTGFVVLLVVGCISCLVMSFKYLPAFAYHWKINKVYKFVCQSTGLAKEGTPAGLLPLLIHTVKNNWRLRKDPFVYPALTKLQGSYEQWQAEIVPIVGQKLKEYQDAAEHFTLAFQVPYVNFDIVPGGRIRIRAGATMVPQSIAHSDTVVPLTVPQQVSKPSTSPTFDALADKARAAMAGVNVAITEDGKPFLLPIAGNHVLTVGRSGAGKGSVIWSAVLGLAPALEAGMCRIWALDPKGIELGYAPHWFYKYADNPDDMLALIEEYRTEMNGRKQMLKGVARKFTPSGETPLNVLLIDELAACTKLMEKKKKEQFSLVLAEILTQGRALGYSVFGALQDPRKETLPDRDLFMVRICLALPEKQLIDMVLGDGSYEKGALADQIPQGEKGAGTGYVVMPEISDKPIMIRAYWTSDERIAMTYRTIEHEAITPLDEQEPVSSYQVSPEAMQFARAVAGVDAADSDDPVRSAANAYEMKLVLENGSKPMASYFDGLQSQ